LEASSPSPPSWHGTKAREAAHGKDLRLAEVAGQAVLAALAAIAVGRLSLAIFAGPVRFWLPLAVPP
jgi:hypothetical protein